MPVSPGDVIGEKYQIEHVIGVGGMGMVVAARHLQVQHRVALKFLAAELVDDAPSTARLLREAQAAGAIRSEHVARVVDVGKLPSGVPYLVMEHLEGCDLARLLEQRGRLPEPVAVSYVLQALVAIAEAHSLGIVHRDLKPSNLFVAEQPDGSALIKVLDFGISKVHLPQAPSAPNLTVTGSLLGSPLYMSPEQIRSPKLVDHRSDIWSIGVILHELVTGKPPFAAEHVSGVLAAIIADAPTSVRSARPELSSALEAIVLRCLQKDPGARFASAFEIAQALLPLARPEDQRFGPRIASAARVRSPAGSAPLESSMPPSGPVSAAAATAQGWAHSKGARDTRVLLRAALIAAAVFLVGGTLLWRSYRPAPEALRGDTEAHSASPQVEPAAPSKPAPPPEVMPSVAQTAAAAVAPVASLAAPGATSAEPASKSRPTARPKPPTQAKVRPPIAKEPKAGPRDPSELIDDRR